MINHKTALNVASIGSTLQHRCKELDRVMSVFKRSGCFVRVSDLLLMQNLGLESPHFFVIREQK